MILTQHSGWSMGWESGCQGPSSVPTSPVHTLPYLGLFLPIKIISKDSSGFHILTCGDSGSQNGLSKDSLLRLFWVMGMAGALKSHPIYFLASRWALGGSGSEKERRGRREVKGIRKRRSNGEYPWGR